MAFEHASVLLEEAISLLQPRPGASFIDATLGGGGHSEALLEKGATVLGLDQDPIALAAASERLRRFGDRFTARQANFSELGAIVTTPVDGVLLDLGVSSPQFDAPERGFSFRFDAPLDMRMSDRGQTAAELIDATDEGELADLIYQLGEERFSRPIARKLKTVQPKTTFQAVTAIEAAVPRKAWPKHIHVATKTFQALRMAVNRELDVLDDLLAAIPNALAPGGRAAIISFHSLEDRKVKVAFAQLTGQAPDDTPKDLPIIVAPKQTDFIALTKKPITASDAELEHNPRSRSAKLRAIARKPKA